MFLVCRVNIAPWACPDTEESTVLTKALTTTWMKTCSLRVPWIPFGKFILPLCQVSLIYVKAVRQHHWFRRLTLIRFIEQESSCFSQITEAHRAVLWSSHFWDATRRNVSFSESFRKSPWIGQTAESWMDEHYPSFMGWLPSDILGNAQMSHEKGRADNFWNSSEEHEGMLTWKRARHPLICAGFPLGHGSKLCSVLVGAGAGCPALWECKDCGVCMVLEGERLKYGLARTCWKDTAYWKTCFCPRLCRRLGRRTGCVGEEGAGDSRSSCSSSQAWSWWQSFPTNFFLPFSDFPGNPLQPLLLLLPAALGRHLRASLHRRAVPAAMPGRE